MGGRPDLSHAYYHLPSPHLGRYQIILLGDRGTCVCEQLAQGRYLAVHWAGVELWVSSSACKKKLTMMVNI